MRIRVITIFPHFFDSCLGEGLLGKAAEKGVVRVEVDNLRRYAKDKHQKVDDEAYGGGAGMVMKVDVWADAIAQTRRDLPGARVVLLTPQGPRLDDAAALRLAREEALVLCCGRYEGVDERVAEYLVDEWLSIGDYVLTGGEAAALVAIDAVARKLPGVVGRAESVETDSFTAGLKHPAYTRPPEFRGWHVPEALLTGNHATIEAWRREEAIRRTAGLRPELACQAAAARVRLAVRRARPAAFADLAAAARAYGLKELVVESDVLPYEPMSVTLSLDKAARKWTDELLIHLAGQPAAGQLSLVQTAELIGAAQTPVTITWGDPPPKGARVAAPVWPLDAASLPALFAWLDRLFGRAQKGA